MNWKLILFLFAWLSALRVEHWSLVYTPLTISSANNLEIRVAQMGELSHFNHQSKKSKNGDPSPNAARLPANYITDESVGHAREFLKLTGLDREEKTWGHVYTMLMPYMDPAERDYYSQVFGHLWNHPLPKMILTEEAGKPRLIMEAGEALLKPMTLVISSVYPAKIKVADQILEPGKIKTSKEYQKHWSAFDSYKNLKLQDQDLSRSFLPTAAEYEKMSPEEQMAWTKKVWKLLELVENVQNAAYNGYDTSAHFNFWEYILAPSTAFAAASDKACIFLGHVSIIKNGKCSAPDAAKKDCNGGFKCNPEIFVTIDSSPICIPSSTFSSRESEPFTGSQCASNNKLITNGIKKDIYENITKAVNLVYNQSCPSEPKKEKNKCTTPNCKKTCQALKDYLYSLKEESKVVPVKSVEEINPIPSPLPTPNPPPSREIKPCNTPCRTESLNQKTDTGIDWQKVKRIGLLIAPIAFSGLLIYGASRISASATRAKIKALYKLGLPSGPVLWNYNNLQTVNSSNVPRIIPGTSTQ